MESAGQKSSRYTQSSRREVVEQEPLMLGLMFPQSHGAWTASLIPIETSIEWQYLETLALLKTRGGDCLNLVFCNYVTELRFFVDHVLPLLKQAGLQLSSL